MLSRERYFVAKLYGLLHYANIFDENEMISSISDWNVTQDIVAYRRENSM